MSFAKGQNASLYLLPWYLGMFLFYGIKRQFLHVSFVKARHNFGTNIQTKTINIFQQKTYGEKIKKDKKLEQNELDELAKKTKLMEQTKEKQKKMKKKT